MNEIVWISLIVGFFIVQAYVRQQRKIYYERGRADSEEGYQEYFREKKEKKRKAKKAKKMRSAKYLGSQEFRDELKNAPTKIVKNQ